MRVEAFARGESVAGVRVFIDIVIGQEGAFDQIPPDIQVAIIDNAPELRLGVDTPFETMHPPFFCEDARQVRVPTLLLSGELSPPFFNLITEELARCLPMVERVTIPGVSHDLGDPQVYAETVLGFLAKH
jgi:pimeloyl-ACP methyl ester carboxylesterase